MWSLRWQQRPAPSSSRSATLTSSQTLTQSSPNPHKPSLNPHLILTSSSPSLVTDDGLYQLQRWPLPTKLCRHTNPTLASLHRCVLSPLFFRYFPVPLFFAHLCSGKRAQFLLQVSMSRWDRRRNGQGLGSWMDYCRSRLQCGSLRRKVCSKVMWGTPQRRVMKMLLCTYSGFR